MVQVYCDASAKVSERSKIGKIIHWLLRVGSFFVILEPIWMLLPFAGFLYGSVMHIQLLSGNPYTAWLVHFVFPVHTLFPLGLILMAAGFSVFLVGAFQIYSAKLFKTGLVKTGIYKTFRHPQYLSLVLFGLGTVLTWGRFITFIAYFIMMWLYFFLSKSEERKCLAMFGHPYEAYRGDTCFLLPGEDILFSFVRRAPGMGLPVWAKAAVSFVLVLALATGSGFLVQAVKERFRARIPVIQGDIALPGDEARKVELVMVKGPALQAAPAKSENHPFWDSTFEMLTSSKKIKTVLHQIDLSERHLLLAFLTPGSGWRSADHHADHHGSMNVYMLVTEAPSDFIHDNIIQYRHDLKIVKLIKAQALSHERFKNGEDPAEGDVIVSGPPPGMADASFQKRIQDRINFYVSGL